MENLKISYQDYLSKRWKNKKLIQRDKKTYKNQIEYQKNYKNLN